MTPDHPSRSSSCADVGPRRRRTAYGVLLAALVGSLLALSPGSATAVETEDPGTPLAVSIDSLSPSTIPRRGPVTISGQVTNISEETWSDLTVFPLTSPTPMTTHEELRAATQTDPALQIGERLLTEGVFEDIGDLEPGQSSDYELTVPAQALQITGAEGVYWLATHVLGANRDGRDTVADGRARTFIPLMSPAGPTAEVSVVLPVRRRVQRGVDGAVLNAPEWYDDLSSDGRLGRVLDLAQTATDAPVTWVADPAVLEAARDLAAGNPELSIEPTRTPDGSATDDASPSEGATATPEEEEEPELSEDEAEVAAWLESFTASAEQEQVLALPYGDADVSALFRRGHEQLYVQALAQSAGAMEGLDLAADVGIVPIDGYLSPQALARVSEEIPVLLTDRAAPGAASTTVVADDGHRVVLTDSATAAGGPPPNERLAALAVRQRLLAEAAVQALAGTGDEPLVVALPHDWDPGEEWRDADFFGGLDVPWLALSSLRGATADTAADAPYDGRLRYPARQRRLEIPLANLDTAATLNGHGQTLAGLLTLNDEVDEEVSRVSLLAASSQARREPALAAASTRATAARLRGVLSQVSIDAPEFGTMSSSEGSFAVTLVNGLDQPVTVGIEARSDNPDLTMNAPDAVEMGAGARTTVRLPAVSEDIGVSTVTLTPTTADGRSLPQTTSFRVRSSQVGLVIWAIIGVGGAGLLLAVGIRAVRGLRRRKATHGPLLATGSADD